MNIITSIGEGLGKLFHGKKMSQVTTTTTSELPKAIAAEIREAGGKIKSGMLATDTLALGTSTQAPEAIITRIRALKGNNLDTLKAPAQTGAPTELKKIPQADDRLRELLLIERLKQNK